MSLNTIVKNTSFITSASVLQKIFSFIYFTLVARTIGVEATGQYTFALAFTTIFVIFVDLGFVQVLIREGAKRINELQRFFSAVLFVKIFLGILTYGALFLTINIVDYSDITKLLIIISGVTMLSDSFHLTCYAVLRAQEQLKYEAFGIVGSQLATLIIGSILLYVGAALPYLMIAFLVPSICNSLFAVRTLAKKCNIYPIPIYDAPLLKSVFKMMIPFAIAAVLARIYSYADTLILAHMMGDIAVGIYSVPYKITYAFQFIPLALVAALYPKLSFSFEHKREDLSPLLKKSVQYLFLIVVPIAIGVGSLAYKIIPFVYTDAYNNSIIPLQILMCGLIFSFISFPLGALLNACNRQHIQTTIIAVVMVVNIILNIILIPIYGVIGAAISAFVGNVLLVIFGVLATRQIISGWFMSILPNLSKIFTSGIGMGLIVWYSAQYVHFSFSIIIGILIYLSFLFVFKIITPTTIKTMYKQL